MVGDLPSLDFLYTETRDRLVRQLDEIEAINTRASVTLGFDGVIIAAALALLADLDGIGQVSSSLWQPWVAPLLVLVGTALVAASLYFALRAYWLVPFKEVIDPRGAYDELVTLPESQSKLQMLHTLIDSYETNSRLILGRSWWLTLSLLSVGLGVLLFFAAAMMTVIALMAH